MSVPIHLDPDVEELLRRKVAEEDLTWDQALNDILRASLAPLPSPSAAQRYHVEPWRFGKLRTGLDHSKLNGIADELEDEAILRSSSRSETAE